MTSPSDNTLVARLRKRVLHLRAEPSESTFYSTADHATIDELDEATTALEASYAENERLREALSDGLDLCSRARNMDIMERERIDRQMRNPEMTRSVTIPIWAEEQYQKDLAAWELRAKGMMKLGAYPNAR